MTALLENDTDIAPQSNLPLSMVERMTLIMEAFDKPLARLTLDEVTRHTGLPRSTAHRILDQLVQCRWLIHAKTHYSLGSRALTLGGRELAQHELRSAASGVLQALAYRTGACTHLVTLAGTEIYYLDMFGGRPEHRLSSRVGGRAPAHRTAAGKAIMAGMAPEQVHNQIMNPARGTGAVRIRSRNGLAVERGELIPGLACVGAAVRSNDGPVGAISVAARADAPLEPIAPLVLHAARTISDALAAGTATW